MATKMIGFTYKPKLEGVRVGSIRQTIRLGRRIDKDDKLILFAWSGKPYRSPWAWRRYEVCTDLFNVAIYDWGFMVGQYYDNPAPWSICDGIAQLDGIVPPTGKELGRLLLEMHKIGPDGKEGQIIRW